MVYLSKINVEHYFMKHLLTRWLSIQYLFECNGCYTRDSDTVTLHADYRVDFEWYIHTYMKYILYIYK